MSVRAQSRTVVFCLRRRRDWIRQYSFIKFTAKMYTMSPGKQSPRKYLQTRNMRTEAESKLKDFDSIMGKLEQEFDALRAKGIPCKAFAENDSDDPEIIQVSRRSWNHVFRHPVKRQSKAEKLERALAWPLALKLLKKSTTYQGVSVETDFAGNTYLAFEISGCIRGNRIKVIVARQPKRTNAQKVLLSWWQMSSAPSKKDDEMDN